MKIHKNARLTPQGREILVRRIVNGGLRQRAIAAHGGEGYLRLERRTVGSACAS